MAWPFPMVCEMVTYDYRGRDAVLVVEHWQDAEVVRDRQLAERDRMLAELAARQQS